MRAKALQIHWHDKQPIFSCHFEPKGKGRLATAGSDHTVRIWKVVKDENTPPIIEFLSSLTRHNAAVNVVRFAPQGEILASAGDDGNVIIWKQAERVAASSSAPSAFASGGEDADIQRESWRVVSMLRGSLSDIYDLAWSPDGNYIVTGSVDNTARIWDVKEGKCIHVLSDHSHFVQGVAWDPRGEYIATQSSDRSVHIYNYTVKPNGKFIVNFAHQQTRMRMPRKTHSESGKDNNDSPTNLPIPNQSKNCKEAFLAVPTSRTSCGESGESSASSSRPQSPAPTSSKAHAMNPPSTPPQHGFRRGSLSPSPKPGISARSASPTHTAKTQSRPSKMYADETLVSFFRRLTFTPDGSLLLTPAGECSVADFSASSQTSMCTNVTSGGSDGKIKEKDKERVGNASGDCSPVVKNTVYIYGRAALNQPPLAHLPGHLKPAIAVACSPVLYQLRETSSTKLNSTSTTSSGTSSPNGEIEATESEKKPNALKTSKNSMFDLPHRVVFAVATQDTVLVYDTQQKSPLVAIGNLHYSTLTDVTWSADGCTLVLASSDGFCSIVAFEQGELGEPLVANGSGAQGIEAEATPHAPSTPIGQTPDSATGVKLSALPTVPPPVSDIAATSNSMPEKNDAPVPKKRRIAPTLVSSDLSR